MLGDYEYFAIAGFSTILQVLKSKLLVRQIAIPLSTKIQCSVQNDQKPARRCTKVLLDLNSCTRLAA